LSAWPRTSAFVVVALPLSDARSASPVLSGFRAFTSDRTRLQAIFSPYNVDIVHLLSHESFGSTVRTALAAPAASLRLTLI
jgi:hypothetical protein